MSDALPPGPVLRPLAEILPVVAAPEAGAGPGSARNDDEQAPALADSVLRAAVEFVAGHRPARQLAAILAPPVMSYLSGLRAAAGPLRPRIRVVHCQQPAPGALEASGLVVIRTGVRALFARFEVAGTGPDAQPVPRDWRCTALHLALTRGDLAVAPRPPARYERAASVGAP